MISIINAFFKRPLAQILLVLIAGVIVYANTFHVPFTLDDARSITQNPVIKNLDNFYANSTGYEFLPNRYFAYLSFALNYQFGDLDVSGYHLVNLIIHLLASLLVYVLLRLTFRTRHFRVQEEASDSVEGLASHFSLFTPRFFIPLFAALLFVIHPIQTQAVTYIVQRLTSLTTLFYLLSVVLYALARLSIEEQNARSLKSEVEKQNAGNGRRVTFALLIIGSALAAVLAMKTKEIAFTLPLTILLYEACFFYGAWKRRLLYLLPLLPTLLIVPMTVLDIGEDTSDILSDTGEQLRVGSGVSRVDYLFTQFRVIVTYLRLLVFPVNQNLDYDYPIYTSFFTPPVFLSFCLLLFIVALTIYLSGFRAQLLGSSNSSSLPINSEFRLIAFGIFWFFLTLSVESSLIPIKDVIMEHRLYLPSFGAATAFATTFCMMAGKVTRPASSKLFFLAAALLILALGFATYQRNIIWGDPIRLWQDVVEKSPNKGRANNNLGKALEDAGRRSEAFNAFSRAIEVDPNYYKAYYNLADIYLVSNQPDKALPLLETAIRLKSDFIEAYVSIGAALMRGGRFQEMTVFLERNLNRIGDNAEARFYLGAAYAFQGNRDAAMRELKIVSKLDPALAADLKGLLR